MGRPKEFEPDVALAQAVELFWKKGYEGASLGELTAVMGITKPSLYGTFGNKEQLFIKALDYYDAHYMGFIDEALAQPDARRVMEHLLRGYVDAQTRPDHPRGCLGVHGANPGTEETDGLHDELVRRRAVVIDALQKRLDVAKAAGELRADANTSDLAMYALVLAQGTATQARAGASRTQLRRMADLALQTWPFAEPPPR